MDDDLKQVLDKISEENAAAHAETRRRLEVMQLENVAAHAETRRRFETLETNFEAAQVENAEAHAKTRRRIDVVAESDQKKLDLVIERVLANGEKIDQLEAKFDQITSNHETRIMRLEVATSLQGRI